MFPTKSLCFARSPKRSVTTPPSNTATRVSSRATVIAISTPIPTPSIQQNRRTDMQDERGESPGSTLHSTSCRPNGSHHKYNLLHRSRFIRDRAITLSLKETQSTAFDIQEQAERRHRHNRRTPAVTHEREGNSHDREHARRHADVDHNTKTQHADDADSQQRPELILRARHNF